MSTYLIKEGQNGLDVVNNTLTTLNSIGTMYLDNTGFTLNEMQSQSNINYNKPVNNASTVIGVNDYTFTNGDVKVFNKLLDIVVPCGIYDTINFHFSTADGGLLDYKVNDNIYVDSQGTTHEYFTLLEQSNTLSFSIDDSVDKNTIFNEIDLSFLNMSSISFVKSIKVTDFSLNLQDSLLTDWSFLGDIDYISVGATSTVEINVSNCIQTTARMESFLVALLSSSLGNIDSGTLTISANDIVPSGSTWTSLEAGGWSYTVV